jgi:hypothetical protein
LPAGACLLWEWGGRGGGVGVAGAGAAAAGAQRVGITEQARAIWESPALSWAVETSPSARAGCTTKRGAARQGPGSARALASPAFVPRECCKAARVGGARSPATMARRRCGPVAPVTSLSAGDNGICLGQSAFCRGRTWGARCGIRGARWCRSVRSATRSPAGRKAACSPPERCKGWRHCQSRTALLRPGPCVIARALSRQPGPPRESRGSNSGLHSTPGDAIAPVWRP